MDILYRTNLLAAKRSCLSLEEVEQSKPFSQEKELYFPNLHSIELHTNKAKSPLRPFTTNLSPNNVIILPFVMISDKLYGS